MTESAVHRVVRDELSKPFSLERTARSYGITILFCLAIAGLLYSIGVSDLRWGLVISLSIGLSICTSFVLFQHWLYARLPPWAPAIPLQLGGLVVGLLIAGWILAGDPWLFILREQSTVVIGIFFAVVVYLIASTRARIASYRLLLAEAEQAEANRARQLADTQLKLLQAQIEPHFLFNTLGNATALVHSDPDGAEAILVNLTQLLRRSLKRTRSAQATLREELEIVRAYLEIAAVRMGERLRYEIEVPEALLDTQLPPLLLQPLIENAIEHGLEGKASGGKLSVRGHRHEDMLELIVEDNGLGLEASASRDRARNEGRGTGLRNIRERLAGRYGAAAKLSMAPRPQGGTCARLSVPLKANAPSSPDELP